MNRLLGAAVICLALQGCSTTPTPRPSEPPQDEAAAPVVLLPVASTAYEAAQRARATDLERDGRLAEAALVWEVLSVIRPHDDDYRQRLAESKRRISTSAAERTQRGDQAAAAGQLDAAVSYYLSALALQPDHAKAADAVRGIERERNRRNHLGKLSRHTMTRKAMADSDMVPAPQISAEPVAATATTRPPPAVLSAAPATRPANNSPSADRIEVEHASLLASQGEFDEAISMLEKWLQGNRRDDAARRLLADVYFQQADRLAASKPEAAITLLEKSLRVERHQPRAAERLRQLKAAAQK